jgi:MoaA/NifB/PqqE/SkfB family radical SAM enzyme
MVVNGGTRRIAAAEPTLRHVLDGIDPKLRSVLLPFALRHPRRFWSYGRLMQGYERARKARKASRDQGLTVPPFLILSITSRCNLRCAGCYARASGILDGHGPDHLSLGRWRAIINEACELGVYGFIVAGGEPFMQPGLLELCAEFDDRVFLIVTNGTAITEEHYSRLKKISNICIVVSIEGGQDVTDARRGAGVYGKAMTAIQRLGRMGVISGVSATVTRDNFRHWMDPANVDDLVAHGVMLGVFIEYIPTAGPSAFEGRDDASLMLTAEERSDFRRAMLSYRDRKPIYIVHSPGDEELFGGCVSAGRGFAHITPSGDLTPCPVSDVATHNLAASTLREGLASRLFKEIRDRSGLLETGDTPCALFTHQKELDEIARTVGAYRTGPEKRKITS